jgi:hypothetical protein
MSDAAVNAVANQENLIAAFDAVMKKLGVLVKVGDEVAKVCSSAPSLLLDHLIDHFFFKKKRSILLSI